MTYTDNGGCFHHVKDVSYSTDVETLNFFVKHHDIMTRVSHSRRHP